MSKTKKTKVEQQPATNIANCVFHMGNADKNIEIIADMIKQIASANNQTSIANQKLADTTAKWAEVLLARPTNTAGIIINPKE